MFKVQQAKAYKIVFVLRFPTHIYYDKFEEDVKNATGKGL